MQLSFIYNWGHYVNWRWIGRHSLFWTIEILLVSLQTMLSGLTTSFNIIVGIQFLPLNLLNTYSLLYGVLPFLLHKRLLKFWVLLLLWCVNFFWIIYLFSNYIAIPLNTGQSIINTISSTYQSNSIIIIFVQASTAIVAASLKLGRYWYQKEQHNQQLTQETAVVELHVLKAQIHPHFLFNTLNNIYALTLTESDKAPDIVGKLSELLHYMLNECNAPHVPLQAEIAAMQQYIDLEKLRYDNRLRVTVDIAGDVLNKQISPLLLLPFVENAFKHGPSQQIGAAYIHVQCRVVDNDFIFTVTNSKNATGSPASKFGGIGLKNGQKRLALLYPNQHSLLIRPEKDRYEVELTIPLRFINAYQEIVLSTV